MNNQDLKIILNLIESTLFGRSLANENLIEVDSKLFLLVCLDLICSK